jgi:serine phosphatase RsbU (regulator of sigma subunit)
LPSSTFYIHHRFRDFLKSIKVKELISVQFLINFVGWLGSFFLFTVTLESGLDFLFFIVHIIFWFRFNKDVVTKIKPPVELLLLLSLVFYSIDIFLLHSLFDPETNSLVFGPASSVFNKFFVAFEILLFGLILVRNNKDKQGVLVAYAFLGFITLQLVSLHNMYYLYILGFFIFFALLKRTIWLESLTKTELWIFWIISLGLFSGFQNVSFFEKVIVDQSASSSLQIFTPYFLHFLIKIYLFALIVKIPIVQIYNFAGLSRKLRISSLFQSTVPQFIQLVVLLFIFYSFISGWQSQNLRQALYTEIENIQSENLNSNLTVFSIPFDENSPIFQFEGYQPFRFSKRFPEVGIVEIKKLQVIQNENQTDQFFYFKSSDSLSQSLAFVKIDQAFIKHISGNLNVLLNTGIISYSYKFLPWQEFIFKFDFLQDDNKIKIFPFALVSNCKTWAIRSEINENEGENHNKEVTVREGLLDSPQFGVGRVIIPIVNNSESDGSYFTFDIYYSIKNISFGSPLFALLAMSVLLFFLINTFVIRRVISFGEQINKIIVQKFSVLKEGIREIASGNLNYKVELEGEDEFVELADHFNQMGERLQETIEDAREKDRLDHELRIARQVQLSLLATQLPSAPGYQIVASLKTATEVGGDFYDVIQLDSERFLFTIGDVSGKGSSAAFYMAQFLSLLRFAPQFTEQPEEIASRLNQYFSNHVKDRQIFVTAIIGILDCRENKVQLIRAGHTLPILLPGNSEREIEDINVKGIGIGLTKSKEIFIGILETKEIDLEKNDVLIFSTDGVVEAACPGSQLQDTPEMKFYGEERYKKILEECRGNSAKYILEELSQDLDRFYRSDPRVDDHTFLIIQRENH